MMLYVGVGIHALSAIVLIGVWIRNRYRLAQTKKKIAVRQLQSQERTEIIQRRLRNTSEEEFDPSIAELSFSELQENLQRGHLTARKVLFAYQHKALSIHNELNCVSDFIVSAEERATYLDSLGPEDRKPLHGIPISLKDAVGVKGMDSTCGVSKFIDDIFEEDGVLLQVLIDQGAIPFVKTNVSQLQLASINCSNPIFGSTKSPIDPNRSPGGSSGGEGALIRAGGSILGVACDLGGGIRIPCQFCGVCGLKPSERRFSNAGNFLDVLGAGTYSDVFGPMGRDVDSLVAMVKASLTPKMFTLDPALPKMPWREEVYSSRAPLRIGYFFCDGGLEPIPAVKRAVMEAKDILRNLGHEVIEFFPPNSNKTLGDLFFPVLVGDGGKLIKDLLKHDAVEKSIGKFLTVLLIPSQIRKPLATVIKLFKAMQFLLCLPQHRVEESQFTVKSPKSVSKWWELHEKLQAYKKKYMRDVQEAGVDVMLSPVYPFAAFHTDDPSGAITGLTYTAGYTILDFPTGILPLTTVTSSDLEGMADYPESNNAEKYVHKISAGSEGLPVAIQLAALPHQEELILRVMKEVENEMKATSVNENASTNLTQIGTFNP